MDANTIAFLRDGEVVELDLSTRKNRVLVKDSRGILAFGWNSLRRLMAYVTATTPHQLYVFDTATGRTQLLMTLSGPQPEADEEHVRELTLDDELRLSWSATGGHLLLTDTLVYPADNTTVHVFGLDGKVVMRERLATFARWGPDGTTVYFRSLEGADWSVRKLGGSAEKLNIRLGRMHPVVAPDGGMIAMDTTKPWVPGTTRKGCTCLVTVYDVLRDMEREVAPGHVNPIWVAPEQILAMKVRACSDDECGTDAPMWISQEAGTALSVDGQERQHLRLPSTIDADVFL